MELSLNKDYKSADNPNEFSFQKDNSNDENVDTLNRLVDEGAQTG